MEENKTKSVQIQNFVYTLSKEDGIVSVAASSGNWYVGFGPGTMAHSLMYSSVFADDKEITEEDKQIVTTIITSMYCACNIIDSEFTESIYKNIEAFMTKNAEKNVDVNSQEQQEKSEEEIEKVKTLTDIEKEMEKSE